MSRNYYSEINLHLVWHTKNSLPLLTREVEPLAQRFLKKRISTRLAHLCMKSAARRRTFISP
jgi:hypothetical protein